jgi:hypothetical protein
VRFTHAVRIASYNRPLYAAAAVGVLAALAVTLVPGTPPALRWIAALSIAIIVWFSCASFLAFHWMFDRSELLAGDWLKTEIAAPERWVQFNVGLEETTVPLGEIFPHAAGKMLDIYDPKAMTEPAITRARRDRSTGTTASDSASVDNGWGDLVLVMLAAHEIRDRSARERFFLDVARIVAPTGKVIVVEHLRDLAAALTFGPGAFHFFPRSEWLRLGKLTGMDLERERRMTPFVRIFVFRPPQRQTKP